VHANSSNLVQINSLHPTNRNHITLNPYHTLSLSKLLKTVHFIFSATDLQKLHPYIKHCHQDHFIMKFKTNTSVSTEKKTTEQREIVSSAPKMVKPLSVVPPSKPNKKNAVKPSSRKKKTVKKGESKVALSMSDFYEKGNPFKATKGGSIA
jgi:hypothetical protein